MEKLRVHREDVIEIAKSIHQTLTDVDIEWVRLCYPDAQKQDPNGSWVLVVENLIYQAIKPDSVDKKIMSRYEAAQALKVGKKLTHRYFTPEEWVKGDGEGYYIMEDGVRCTAAEFWKWRQYEDFNTDWSIFKE
jgi:hypothetical protein